jgi:hypothetical protein
MIHVRHTQTLLTAALVGSLALLGCSKDGGSSSSSGNVTAEAKGSLAYFPKDTAVVLGVNFGGITGSALFKKYKSEIEGALGEKPEFKKMKDECGIDPLTDFKSVIVGTKFNADGEPDDDRVFLVMKGPARGKLMECAKKMASEDSPTFTDEGKFTKIEKDGETKWIAWADDNTLMGGPNMDKAALEARMAGKGGLTENGEMMSLIGGADTSEAIWVAGVVPKGAPTGDMPVEPQGGYLTLDPSDGLELDFGVRAPSADDAKKGKDQISKELDGMKENPMAGKYADKIKVSTSGADLLINIDLSMKDIEELTTMAQAFLGPQIEEALQNL